MKLTLKKKLTLAFVLTGFVPMTTICLISYFKARSELQSSYFARLDAIAELKSEQVQGYFQEQADFAKDFASHPAVVEAMKAFAENFTRLESDIKEDRAKVAADVESFYSGAFAKAYLERSAGGSASAVKLFNLLDTPALYAQYAYISRNPAALGSKHEATSSPVKTRYDDEHARRHTFFRTHLETRGFYDIFLFTPDTGRIVYTVFKELDYGTSVVSGPYRESGLAKAFQGARSLKAREIWFEDYALYTPSYEAPASFLTTPIYDGGKVIGVLGIQLPLDKVTAVMSMRAGLGEGGETYLAGPDGLLRSDTYRNKDTHTVIKAFQRPEQFRMKEASFENAKSGQSGVMMSKTYDGTEVLGTFDPIEILGKRWVIFNELPAKEALHGLRELTLVSFAIFGFAMLGIAFLGAKIASSIARRLEALAHGLGASSTEVAGASQRIAVTSTKLSEAATEQAASLQETVASVEEISAMINQNAEASTKSSDASALSRREAEDGQRTVGHMLAAIGEIRSSNEVILQQMETGNREIGEIVKVITAIGEKTKVINDIVFQTKLLSFNASVEAARAGEAGKGFAVVAEEVGNLAQMSGNAAKEISSMLDESTRQVQGIVERTGREVDRLVQLGREKVSVGESTATKCRDALDRILGQVSSVADMVTEISNASREQAQGVHEIKEAMNQLDSVTQQNSLSAQESSAQADDLQSEADGLKAHVQNLIDFVNGDDATPTATVVPLRPVATSRPKTPKRAA